MAISLPQFEDGNLLTHSGESCFKTCQRKFYLRYVVGLQSKHDSNPLRMGTSFHLGLECLKHGETEQQAEQAVRDTYADAQCPPWLDAEEFAVEEETAVALVKGYARRYGSDAIIQFKAVELSFNVPIVNPETGRETPVYRSAGKIDGIAELPDGRIALVEHKTTSESLEADSPYWGRLMMDSQISRYFLAAKHLGYDVQTTVFDVTRKPAVRPKAIAKAERQSATYNGHYHGIPLSQTCPERETPKMYGARLLADLEARPEFYFQRKEIVRLESDLEEFRREQWILQQAMRDAALKARAWGASAYPRNTGACLTMGTCPYFQICRGLAGDINEQIPEGFQVATRLHRELSVVQSTEENND